MKSFEDFVVEKHGTTLEEGALSGVLPAKKGSPRAHLRQLRKNWRQAYLGYKKAKKAHDKAGWWTNGNEARSVYAHAKRVRDAKKAFDTHHQKYGREAKDMYLHSDFAYKHDRGAAFMGGYMVGRNPLIGGAVVGAAAVTDYVRHGWQRDNSHENDIKRRQSYLSRRKKQKEKEAAVSAT